MRIDKDERRAIVYRLDTASGIPTYLQIVRQVEDAVRLGYLVSGDRLPKVKDVVESLAINPNTVLKAYRELEHKGLASGRPGQGTFVLESVDIAPLRDLDPLRRKLVRWIAEATAAGLDEASIDALFSSAFRDARTKGVIAS